MTQFIFILRSTERTAMFQQRPPALASALFAFDLLDFVLLAFVLLALVLLALVLLVPDFIFFTVLTFLVLTLLLRSTSLCIKSTLRIKQLPCRVPL